MAETLVLFFTGNDESRWRFEERNKWVVGRLDGWVSQCSLDGELVFSTYHDTLDRAIEYLRLQQEQAS